MSLEPTPGTAGIGEDHGLRSRYVTTMEDEAGTVFYRFWSAQASMGNIAEFDDAGVSRGVKVTAPERAPDSTERFQTSPLQSYMYR